jgi:hypothetical protein
VDTAVRPKSASNDALERPTAGSDRAPCAHNRPGAHGAPLQQSRPLQAFVRRPDSFATTIVVIVVSNVHRFWKFRLGEADFTPDSIQRVVRKGFSRIVNVWAVDPMILFLLEVTLVEVE